MYAYDMLLLTINLPYHLFYKRELCSNLTFFLKKNYYSYLS